GQAVGREVHAAGTGESRDVRAIVDQNGGAGGRRRAGEPWRQLENRAAVSARNTGVEAHGRGNGERWGAGRQVRQDRDGRVGHRVDPGNRGLHPNRSRTRTPRPRTHAATGIRSPPAGCTSANSSAPLPVVTHRAGSVRSTVPGAAPSPED